MIKFNWFNLAIGLTVLLCQNTAEAANGSPKTPEEFAAQYMAAFNSKDKAALTKLRYPMKAKSAMQEMLDEMSDAEMKEGVKYSKFEIQPVKEEMKKPVMGLDGGFYVPNLQPTNVIKMTAVTQNGSTSSSFPIGVAKGVYYQAAIEPAKGNLPAYQFGWQRCSVPKSNWSVMLPNEAEPGRAALEDQYGKDALNDPDIFGVVKNTASIKTTQHWIRSGEEGKRVNDEANKEIFRAACTTYTPETIKEWFSDPKKTLDDAINSAVLEGKGKLVSQQDIELAGGPGKEYEIVDADGTLHLGRKYWIKDALYELSFESKKQAPDKEAAGKFLQSLQVE